MSSLYSRPLNGFSSHTVFKFIQWPVRPHMICPSDPHLAITCIPVSSFMYVYVSKTWLFARSLITSLFCFGRSKPLVRQNWTQATQKKCYSWPRRGGKRSFCKQWQNFTFKQLKKFYFLNNRLNINSIKRWSLYIIQIYTFSGVFFPDKIPKQFKNKLYRFHAIIA